MMIDEKQSCEEKTLRETGIRIEKRGEEFRSEGERTARKKAMRDLFGWLLAFFLLMSLLGIICYQLMCLADLEFDYTNPYDSASRINWSVMPEFFIQGALCFSYLITGNWFMCLLSLPYLYFNIRLYRRREHLVDVTEIYNQLNWEKKMKLTKLFYVITILIVSLFCLLWTVGQDGY